MSLHHRLLAASLFCGLLATACAHKEAAPHPIDQAPAAAKAEAEKAALQPATAKMTAAKGQKVKGTVRFTPEADGIRVVAQFEGLKPKSKHGFHIHEIGDCSAPDFKTAGGHYNPTNAAHGSPEAMPHHTGDLGNLEADAKGKVTLDKVFPGLKDAGAALIGRAVVLHEKADDLKSQPAGESGARIACGVIGADTP